jgi:DNA modification methylase
LDEDSVQCVVTSPPYWGLRDYGVEGQLGAEKTPEEYVERLVKIFLEVKRVLRGDGTVWLNLGDTYAASPRGDKPGDCLTSSPTNPARQDTMSRPAATRVTGLRSKNLVGIPWRTAFALQTAGWILRNDIIWQKPNVMPDSVKDRCTRSHEYLFLLTKSPKYHCDMSAIREEAVGTRGGSSFGKQSVSSKGTKAQSRTYDRPDYKTRNRRTVWTIPTRSYHGAHFAVFPEKLVEPCVLAGCPKGGVVLDPFVGSGTTAVVCRRLGRKCVGIDLNREYLALASERIRKEMG